MADPVTPEWAKRVARDSWPLDEPTDLIAAVRRLVESGTIEGMEIETSIMRVGKYERRVIPIEYTKPGRYLVIPVSDGGSET